MTRGRRVNGLVLGLVLLVGCIRPGDERGVLDDEVGKATLGNMSVEVVDGQAQVRSMSSDELVLWAQAPELVVHFETPELRPLRVRVENCMPDAFLGSEESLELVSDTDGAPTRCAFDVVVPAGSATFRVGPPDAASEEAFRVVVMGDIQTGLHNVDDVFRRINGVDDVRFVVATGDLVEDGRSDEYALLLEQLEELEVPFFSTIGNHELWGDETQWLRLFGRYNLHFYFKGAGFSFVDSANASIDPIVYDRLEGWLDRYAGRVHLFGTHYPAFDPVGVRNASFRSRREASKLLSRLAEGQVDTTFYGHIHSYYAFENAGIPAYVSGGGGAWPERYDGIGRHALVVDVDPVAQRVLVSLLRVD